MLFFVGIRGNEMAGFPVMAGLDFPRVKVVYPKVILNNTSIQYILFLLGN